MLQNVLHKQVMSMLDCKNEHRVAVLVAEKKIESTLVLTHLQVVRKIKETLQNAKRVRISLASAPNRDSPT